MSKKSCGKILIPQIIKIDKTEETPETDKVLGQHNNDDDKD